MNRDHLIKRVRTFAVHVNRISNISTVVLLAIMAYTISQWQGSMDIDNFSNVLVMLLVLTINIKFYKIYLSISSFKNETADASTERVYKHQKREYYKLLRISLWIAIVFLIAKLH